MNSRLLTTTGLGFFAGLLLAGSASAADIIPTYVEPEERIEQGWRVALTARLWYFWENDVYFQNDGAGTFQQSNETIDVPFAGGSISITPPGLGGTTFSLTGLYGEGEGEVIGVGVLPTRLYNADVEMSRLDIEGIAQIPIAGGVSGIVGARFINFQRDESGVFVTPGPVVTPATFDLEQNFYLGELGFGVTQPVNQANTVFLFGNVTGMAGYADVVDTSGTFGVFNVATESLEGGVAGVDTNAGGALKLSDNVLLSARYRLFYLTNPDFEINEGGTFIHGPEANVTVSFGG